MRMISSSSRDRRDAARSSCTTTQTNKKLKVQNQQIILLTDMPEVIWRDNNFHGTFTCAVRSGIWILSTDTEPRAALRMITNALYSVECTCDQNRIGVSLLNCLASGQSSLSSAHKLLFLVVCKIAGEEWASTSVFASAHFIVLFVLRSSCARRF